MENDRKQLTGLFSALTFILVFFLFSRTPVDADMWWHLRAGQFMWQHKQILLVDPFSYTRLGAPWVNAFWLSELWLYFLYAIGGYLALASFVSICGALTFYLVGQRMRGNPVLGSFVIILAAMTAGPVWGPRPQIISFFFTAVLDYWIVEDRDGRPRPLWPLPLFFAFWANLHGGWIWGFLLLIAHSTGLGIELVLSGSQENQKAIWQRISALSGWSVVAALAIAINPNGISIWKLPFQQISVSMQIQEWLSPDFHRVDFHPMLWMLFFLLLTAPFSRNQKPDWSQIIKVIGFAYLSFVVQRNIAVYAIVAAPLLFEWASAALKAISAGRHIPLTPINPRWQTVFNTVILVVLGLSALGNLIIVSQPSRVDKNYPVGAVDWIRVNRPQGRLFNSYNWGGYILWTLPEVPVFIDGRADMYDTDLIKQWQDVIQGAEDAISILDAWHVQTVLVEPAWPIVSLLKDHGWHVVYTDEKSVLLLR